jgi:hypothetical protein
MVRHIRRRRKPRLADDGEAVAVWLTCQARPFFQQVDFHLQLVELALQLGDLSFVFSGALGVPYFIGKLVGFVFPEPLAEQIERQTMLSRQFSQTHPLLHKVKYHLALELQVESSMPCHESISPEPTRLVLLSTFILKWLNFKALQSRRADAELAAALSARDDRPLLTTSNRLGFQRVSRLSGRRWRAVALITFWTAR